MSSAGDSLPFWVALLLAMALVPLLATMMTSFTKLVVVGGLVRQALGTTQVPPTSVITGLALVLSLHIMAPVIAEAHRRLQAAETPWTPQTIVNAVEPPLREFLEHQIDDSEVALFRQTRKRLLERQTPQAETSPDGSTVQSPRWIETLTIYAPAFVLSELRQAFQIGFLIFIPFIVIDLIVGNVLQALGMYMMSPLVISLPFKLLLFVCIDGWKLLFHGLVLGYA